MLKQTEQLIIQDWLDGESMDQISIDYFLDRDEVEQVIREAFVNGNK